MPKKTATKHKKKLIFEFGDTKSAPDSLPKQYTGTKQLWLCEIESESPEGEVTEYDLKPDGKQFLNEFLASIRVEITNLLSADCTGWSVRIYRLVKGK